MMDEDAKKEPVVLSKSRNRWYTNEEVASILTNFSSHPEWQTNELQIRPKSGAVLLYSREKVRYRQDGYCWKKRKNGRTTREDHMKLKVQGIECIYGCYVHSAILPTFHRRCYWLLENPDIVLVHYLNQPPDDQNKMMITFNSSMLEADTRRTWTNEEIIEEIGSVFGGISQIQQTLNLNFPPPDSDMPFLDHNQSSTIISAQTDQASRDLDRMIESSPLSQATTISESNSEQVEMTIVKQSPGKNIEQSLIEYSSTEDQNNHHSSHVPQTVSSNEELVHDELMSIGQESDTSTLNICPNLLKHLEPVKSTSNSLVDNPDHNAPHPERSHGQQDRLHDETISMNFDVVNEGMVVQTSTSGNCYSYPGSIDQIGENEAIDGSINSNNGITVLNRSGSVPNQNTSSSLVVTTADVAREQDKSHREDIDQLPCSPVTQIFNKIVDDIETYALPLEPPDHQFNSNHHIHHHHSMTMSYYDSLASGEDSNFNHEMRFASLSPNIPLNEEVTDQSGTRYQHSSSPKQQKSSSDFFPASIQLPRQARSLDHALGNLLENVDSSSRLLPIVDYVPDWCFVTGGAKVLIIGNWSSLLISKSNDWNTNPISDKQETPFYAVFDDLLVPATLIQDNVLRCYVPSHRPGFIALKVLYRHRVVSGQVLFEIRPLAACSRSQGQLGSNFQTSEC